LTVSAAAGATTFGTLALVQSDFRRNTFDHRLRAQTIITVALRLGLRLWSRLRGVGLILGKIDIVLVVAEFTNGLLCLKLSLRRCNNAVVVFSVLQVILGHHTIARAMCIARQGSVLVCYLLSRATDFNVRSVALISTRQRIWAPAVVVGVVVAVIIIITAAANAPVLLLWPHSILFA